MTPDVLLATCAEFPDGDREDGAALLAALGRAGVAAQWRAWDDPSAPWDSTPTVLRSSWDYTGRRAEFVAWAETVPRLFNPAPVVDWNSDKRYLLDLERAGVPITPTTVVEAGEPVPMHDGEVVVKPSVGAGSRGAGRFTDPAAAAEHAAALHAAGRTVLVQPYLAEVDTAGETALVHLAGEFSHAVRKSPMLVREAAHRVDGDALYVEERLTARAASAAERAVADRALAHLQDRFGPLLYARIDLLPGPDGPVVVEAELIEPSLLLWLADGATDRFASAIAARL